MIDAGIVLRGGRAQAIVTREEMLTVESIDLLPSIQMLSDLATMSNVFLYQDTQIIDGAVRMVAVSAVPTITTADLPNEVDMSRSLR